MEDECLVLRIEGIRRILQLMEIDGSDRDVEEGQELQLQRLILEQHRRKDGSQIREDRL